MINYRLENRVRVRGQFQSLPTQALYLTKSGTIGSQVDDVIPKANGTYGTMSDTVTKPFVPGLTLVNTKMFSREETRSTTALVGQQDFVTTSDPGPYATVKISGSQRFGPWDTIFDTGLAKLKQNDDAIIQLACTKALAGIRKAEVSGLVTIAEARETLKSLLNPIQGALSFLSRNAPGRKQKSLKKRLSKRGLRSSAEDLANQHLTVVFGLQPFISDIQGILKALASIEPTVVRMTSRGKSSYTDDGVDSTQNVLHYGSTDVNEKYDTKYQKAVTARAFQLYESSVSISNLLGLNVADVPKAMWQTATLSFVVDWFANVGDVISALTPQEGITYLASGYTLITVTACSATYKQTVGPASGVSDNYWTGKWVGDSQRVVVAKQRVPTDLLSHVRLNFKSDMSKDLLDTFKVCAGISLIIQRLKAFA